MDSMADINAPVCEPAELELSSNHPGREDAEYIRRRKMFFYLARDLRLRNFPAPRMPYTDEEGMLWRDLCAKLDALHSEHAVRLYREGKTVLRLVPQHIPQLVELEPTLHSATGVRLVPAEGLLHGKTYFGYWAERIMPCTLFLRHSVQPGYTPEPDIVHDVIGHVPPLMDRRYVELIQLIGNISLNATPEQLEQLVRLYWFSVEFGLLEEDGAPKILGAGILSSSGEIEYVKRGGPRLRPFTLAEVIATPFDPTRMQQVLFVAPSLQFIMESAEKLRENWQKKAA